MTPWAYYPGSSYVDWIGFDGYSKLGDNGQPLTFDQIFSGYITYITSNPNTFGTKPIMIGETGSCNQYPSPNNQASYVNSIQTELDSQTYPSVHAFLYFDAPSTQYFYHGDPCDWSLQNNGNGDGLGVFENLAKDSNFTGMVTSQNP